MSDVINITIEQETIEVDILDPDFIQVNYLEASISESIVLNSAHREGNGSDHSDVAFNSTFVDAGGYNASDNKNTPIDADILSFEDSTNSFVKIKVTWANIKATLNTWADLLYTKIFNLQEHGTITTSAALNATTATNQTGDFTAGWTATLTGFTDARDTLKFSFTVSGGGAPSITLTGYTFLWPDTQTLNLSTMADGEYEAMFSWNATTGKVTVRVQLVA